MTLSLEYTGIDRNINFNNNNNNKQGSSTGKQSKRRIITIQSDISSNNNKENPDFSKIIENELNNQNEQEKQQSDEALLSINEISMSKTPFINVELTSKLYHLAMKRCIKCKKRINIKKRARRTKYDLVCNECGKKNENEIENENENNDNNPLNVSRNEAVNRFVHIYDWVTQGKDF